MLPIRSKIQYLQTERKILESVCNTKLKGDRTSLLKTLNSYDEIMPKLQVVSFVEVRNPEPRQEITTEDIKGWLEDFKANSSKENIRDIVKKIKGFKTMLFILFDGHPFIFPRIEGDKIQNLRWNEFEVDTAEEEFSKFGFENGTKIEVH